MPLLPPVHLPVIALAACYELGFVRGQSIRGVRRPFVSTTHFGHVLPRRRCSKNFVSKLSVLESKAVGSGRAGPLNSVRGALSGLS